MQAVRKRYTFIILLRSSLINFAKATLGSAVSNPENCIFFPNSSVQSSSPFSAVPDHSYKTADVSNEKDGNTDTSFVSVQQKTHFATTISPEQICNNVVLVQESRIVRRNTNIVFIVSSMYSSSTYACTRSYYLGSENNIANCFHLSTSSRHRKCA